MNELYRNMLEAYDLTTAQDVRNATFEVNQQIILSGLAQGGFFDVAAFYGGTCLRVFHGLQRFSEDMDFSLLVKDERFDFTRYFQPIMDEFALVGRRVEIKKKEKKKIYTENKIGRYVQFLIEREDFLELVASWLLSIEDERMQLLRQFIFEVELSETEELKNVLYQYGSYLTEKNYLERKFFEYMA